ncbi:MAG: hypothetical protein KBD76_16535, partial [Bacteriovorax sp.]|nr:hypothetical protein [Bacteriovorax sp.]
VTYMSKQNGKLFTFRMTTIYLVLALILYFLTVQRINSLPHSKFKKYYNYCFITILLLFSHFQPEKIIKYPLKYYTSSTGELIKDKVDHWDSLLKENLTYRENKTYVFSPKLEIFPYFSRYPFISLYDSNPRYRYNYYENNK